MKCLTPQRVSIYCSVLIATNLLFFAFTIARDRGYDGGDFRAFHNAGRIFVQYPHERLYDVGLQDALYESAGGSHSESLPFVYAPWFVLPFALLGQMPFLWAYLLWTMLSIGLLCAGYLFTAKTLALPKEWRIPGLLASLAFAPFQLYAIRGGQTSAFGFCVLAIAFCLHYKGRHIWAGLALALLLYKPPLVVLLLPMLILTFQWRMLLGFTVGAVTLALLSLVLVGAPGIAGYFRILKLFYVAANSPTEIFQTWKYVDIGAAFRLLTGHPGDILRFVLVAVALPFLWRAWRRGRAGGLSWALAVACTLLLSLYSPIYDATLLILVIIWAGPKQIGDRLLVALFVLSFITVGVASVTKVQLFTIALCWLAWRLYSLPGSPYRLMIQTKITEES